MKDLKSTVIRMNDRLNSIEGKWENDCPPRVADSFGNASHSSIADDLKDLKKELREIKPSKNDRSFRFQGLAISDLKDMHGWLEENVPSMNYALIVDLHGIFEHINH